MIDSVFGGLTIGFLLGAPAGIAPGPMLVLIISEAVSYTHLTLPTIYSV